MAYVSFKIFLSKPELSNRTLLATEACFCFYLQQGFLSAKTQLVQHTIPGFQLKYTQLGETFLPHSPFDRHVIQPLQYPIWLNFTHTYSTFFFIMGNYFFRMSGGFLLFNIYGMIPWKSVESTVTQAHISKKNNNSKHCTDVRFASFPFRCGGFTTMA